MKLQVGQIYLTLDGNKVEIISKQDGRNKYIDYPYNGRCISECIIPDAYWTEDGKFNTLIIRHPWDLIKLDKSVKFKEQLSSLMKEEHD